MRRWKMIYLLLTSKDFRFWLKYTLIYALSSYELNRGHGASDVLIFDKRYGDVVFDPEELSKERSFFSEHAS